MGKKIIIINGSPRPGGNTAGLIEAFTAGAESAGHTVTRFDIQQMNVQPCLGCLRGGSVKDGFCTQCDDMDLIYPVYEEAGIFVFASPLYYYTFSAQFFTALNRLFAVTEARGMKTPHKECCLLMAAEEDTEEAFAPVVAYYNTLMKNLGWKDIGRVLAGGVNEVGDIAGKPILENARKLGATL